MAAKTTGITRGQNHDDNASFGKSFKTCDNHGASDLDYDVLFLVMMQLRFIDFLAFSGVCKSWRSVALNNRDKFMASKPPMLMSLKYRPNKNECYLEDFEGRKVKTPLPYSADRRYIGLTRGYLIFFGEETHDFLLVNPITRDELYVPGVPFRHFHVGDIKKSLTAVLVFSPSLCGWVFVLTYRLSNIIWFYIDGKGAWNHVSSTFFIDDLHVFKGKIYALNNGRQVEVCEMSLNTEPKLTLLEINNHLNPFFLYPKFVSGGENHLYVIDANKKTFAVDATKKDPLIRELDLGKMEWVLPEEKTIGKYAFFLKISWDNVLINAVAVKLESGAADSWSKYKIYNCFFGTSQKAKFFATRLDMWYFPHECMNLNLIDE